MFTCCQCQQKIGDDLYYRLGHSPNNVCFDCWCNEWYTNQNKSQMEMMLYLLSYTELTLAEIAKAINVTSKTLYNWRQKIRKSPKLIDDYLEELRQQEKLDRRNRKVAVRQYKNGYE